MLTPFPSFGEVFITNDEVMGSMENLRMFKGKLISNICGGCKKLFIIEDGHGNEGVISTLHAPEFDNYDQTFIQSGQPEVVNNLAPSDMNALEGFDNKGQVTKIATGKKHTVFITEDGKIYSYGYGEYGALGHGGMIESKLPKSISRLTSRPVYQVACGEFHTVVLTQTHDMYAWGRGFEGQLGVRDDVDTSSVPMFIPYFYKNPAVFIACGAYHSLAIDQQGRLYAWGEARFGQLGNGKQVKETTPILVNMTVDQAQQYQQELEKQETLRMKRREIKQQRSIPQAQVKRSETENISPENSPAHRRVNQSPELKEKRDQKIQGKIHEFQRENTIQSQFKISPLTNLNPNPYPKIVYASAGYGHTACITDSGEIYTFGFNQRGQLGHGNQKSRYYPKMVVQDILGNQIPLFRKITCGYYTTFAIDQQGHVWSWGGGNLGHKGDKQTDLPRRIIENAENRKFVDVMVNGQAAVFFAQMNTLSIRPNYGPSCGGTLITLIGTGFCDTGRQSVRFSFGVKCVQEVACIYDDMTDSFSCTTPRFEENGDEHVTNWPLECKVEVTLDGIVYIACEQIYLIYSSKLSILSLYPKCASVEGGTTLILNINIDEKTASYMKHLNVGFQPRSKREKEVKKMTVMISPTNQLQPQLQPSMTPSQQEIQIQKNILNQDGEKQKNQLNPLDLSTNDPELDKENWICVEGFYEKGKISCTVPNVSNSQTDALNYSVDVSINGQQFTGNAIVFRFYDIKINSILPDNVMSEGGTAVRIEGEGFFDTVNKKVIFKTDFGERLIEIQWDKKDRCYSLVAPPLTWLLGGQQPTPELMNEVKKSGVEALLTLSGVEWIRVGKFYYIDPEVTRIAPVTFPVGITEDEKKHKFALHEEEIDPYAACVTEPDRVKKQDEVKKLLDAEDNEILIQYKKAGALLYLFGQNFIDTENLVVQFIYGVKAIIIKGIFKNSNKIGVQVPDIEDLTLGIHDVIIEISLNNQQFSRSKKSFRYMAFDKAMTADQRVKYEDEEIKRLKKPPGKK